MHCLCHCRGRPFTCAVAATACLSPRITQLAVFRPQAQTLQNLQEHPSSDIHAPRVASVMYTHMYILMPVYYTHAMVIYILYIHIMYLGEYVNIHDPRVACHESKLPARNTAWPRALRTKPLEAQNLAVRNWPFSSTQPETIGSCPCPGQARATILGDPALMPPLAQTNEV